MVEAEYLARSDSYDSGSYACDLDSYSYTDPDDGSWDSEAYDADYEACEEKVVGEYKDCLEATKMAGAAIADSKQPESFDDEPTSKFEEIGRKVAEVIGLVDELH